MEIKVLQLHKKSSIEFKYIQDKYSLSNTKKCIALSDGTTQSFKSELWSAMLVDNFISNPLFDIDLFKQDIKELANKFKNTDFEFSSNFAKASLEKAKKNKGGTATFIAIQFINDSTIKILNCGDTCLFIVRNNKIISFPYKSVEELDNNHNFINTNKLLENEIENEFFDCKEITILNDDIVILATDAISRLILRKPESISLILECNNFEDLKSFCEANWENKELEEDDISIIIVNPITSNKIVEIIPPEDFSFPSIVENEFIPSLENQNFTNNIDSAEMEQLNRMIGQLFKETNFLKNKLKLTQALLVSALAILILNTLLLFYFINRKSQIVPEVETKNQVSTQYEYNEPMENVETVDTKTDEVLNNTTTSNGKVVENENVKKEKTETKTIKPKINLKKQITISKPENVISKPKPEGNEKNITVKTETKKDTTN